MRPRRIIPYRMILITGLSLVRNINILSRVCKTGKVYILHARHTLPFVVYIFFKCKIFTFFKLTKEVASCCNNPMKLLRKCYCWVWHWDEDVCVTSLRNNVIKMHLKNIQVHIQVHKESNISVYVTSILFIFH